jgi:hypothetical protein
MPEYRTIEVDFDVHKLIENERRSFDDSPNAALRRLLKLGPAPSVALEKEPNAKPLGRAWTDSGAVLPHGTPVRMPYGRNSQLFEGEIIDGRWVVAGRTFDSPSGAASELAITRRGRKTKLNGWVYWEVKLPGETEWVRLDSLRKASS